jgi:hypothetical protein
VKSEVTMTTMALQRSTIRKSSFDEQTSDLRERSDNRVDEQSRRTCIAPLGPFGVPRAATIYSDRISRWYVWVEDDCSSAEDNQE